MAEAELRRETEKMFQDMGIEDESIGLDFFEKNLENDSDWKSSLKGPSTRPRRTISDGHSLLHLKKKYSTGIDTEKRNAAIAAVTKVSDGDIAAENSGNGPAKLRTKRLSPASGLGVRFGYTGLPAGTKGNSTTTSTEPEEDITMASPAKETELKRRPHRSSVAVSPADTSASNSAPARRLIHTSSAGAIRQSESRGQALHESNISRKHLGSTRATECSAIVVNGVNSPMPQDGVQQPTANHHSYKSSVATAANTTSSPSSSNGPQSIHNSIDSKKLSSVNMRSLTKSSGNERKISAERKISTERNNISTERSERKKSVERKLSDSEGKASFIPVPKQIAALSKTSSASKASETSDSNTQVLYSRKSSFKVVNVSSSSHRIMHTVQDGGSPKRQNSINRGPRPVSVVAGVSSLQSTGLKMQPPASENHSMAPKLGKQASSGSGQETAMSTPHTMNEEREAPMPGARTTSQKGVYDRLLEKPASKPPVEPVYETIQDGCKTSMTSPPPAKEDAESHIPKAGNSLRLGRSSSENKVRGKMASASKSLHQAPDVDAPDHFARSLKLGDGDMENSSSGLKGVTSHSRPGQQQPEVSQTAERIVSPTSSLRYTAVNRRVAPPPPHQQEKGRAGREKDPNTHQPESSSRKVQAPRTHKALCSSLSDTSSESWQAKPLEASSESDRSLHSSSVHSPDPVSDDLEKKPGRLHDGDLLDADKRKALLELNVSEQSINQSMRKVATSTVAALSTLMGVLTSPASTTEDKTFSYDSEDTSDKKWYHNSDDDEDSSSAHPLSLSHGSGPGSLHHPQQSGVTSPTSLTSPTSPHHLQQSGAISLTSPTSPQHPQQSGVASSTSPTSPHHPGGTSPISSHHPQQPEATLPDHAKSNEGHSIPTQTHEKIHKRTNSLQQSSQASQASQVNPTRLPSQVKKKPHIFSQSTPSYSGVTQHANRISVIIPISKADSQSSTANSSPEVSQQQQQQQRQPSQISSTRSGIPVRGDTQVDGGMQSRLKRITPRPPVPPKQKRQRSKSADDDVSSKRNGQTGSSRKIPKPPAPDPPRSEGYQNGTSSSTEEHETSLTSLESYGNSSKCSQSSKTSLVRTKSTPMNHDYAILESPVDHDYAVLDPEYHEEFYGYCASCNEPVIGMKNGCAALEKVYHVKCFNCSKCGISLSRHGFYTSKGKLLCENDHQVTFEYCYHCNKTINDRVLKALGRSYHPLCFRCVVCGKCLDGIHFTSDTKNRVYCVQDYHKTYGPKCDVCQRPITPKNGQKRSLRVIAMDRNYHIHCYKCEDCGKQLANRTGGGEKCYPLNGHLLCRHCHSQRRAHSSKVALRYMQST